MKSFRNIGHHERVLRVGLGFVFLALSGFSVVPWWGDLVLMTVGLVSLVTGIIGYCPAWQLMGVNTCPKHKTEDAPPFSESPVQGHTDSPSHR